MLNFSNMGSRKIGQQTLGDISQFIVGKLTNAKDKLFIGKFSAKDHDNILKAEFLVKAYSLTCPDEKDTADLLSELIEIKIARSGSIEGIRAEQLTSIANTSFGMISTNEQQPSQEGQQEAKSNKLPVL